MGKGKARARMVFKNSVAAEYYFLGIKVVIPFFFAMLRTIFNGEISFRNIDLFFRT